MAAYSSSGSGVPSTPIDREAHSSAVSWGAVIAGAFVTAALSLVLLALGAGFGLETVSPWSGRGASATAVGTGALIWLIVIEILASAFGGYLAGRLRTKWTAIHTDEVYFRDTAHGFLVWAVAVVITAAFLGSAASAMLGRASEGSSAGVPANAYFVDALFQTDQPPTPDHPVMNAGDSLLHVETSQILAHALRQGDTAAGDQAYLAQLVSARTGLSAADAERRVSDVLKEARQTADVARKATARMLLWTFLALLIGAFCASVAATVGGRQRDHMKPI